MEKIRKIMLATNAFHPATGIDVSSDFPDVAFIREKRDDVYIGNWIYGFGLINVEFPVKTTRPLTPPEADWWCKRGMSLAGIVTRFKREEFAIDTLHFPEHRTYTYFEDGREKDWVEPPEEIGWYHWDETWSTGIGPFKTRWEAEKSASWYMMFLSDQLRGRLCPERPEALIGQPLGQYHCPVCGMMCVAGVPHLWPSPFNPDRKMYRDPEDIFWKLAEIEERKFQAFVDREAERLIKGESKSEEEPVGILSYFVKGEDEDV